MNTLFDKSTQSMMTFQNQSHDIHGDEEFMAIFLDNKRQSSENTYRSYKMELLKFLSYIRFPQVGLKDITFKICLSYRNYLNQSQPVYAESTVARKLNIVSSLLKFGVKIGYLADNPMSAVIKPKVQVTTQNRYLLKEEAKTLLEFLKPHTRNHLIASMLLYTGLRSNELVHVKWRDFYIDPKGRIGLKVTRKRNKKGVVKIPTSLFDLITHYRFEQGKGIDLDPNLEEPLFTNYKGHALSDRYVRKMLKEAAFKAGITKSISTHWLRHTSASLAINGGADIKTCMMSYGWEHMQTAQRYIHDMNQLDKTAVDFIDIL